MQRLKAKVKITAYQPHQVVVDEHGQLREGRVADLVLPVNLKAPENTGIEPSDCFREKITL